MKDDTISRRATIEALAGLVDTRAKTDAEKTLVGRCIYIVKQVPGTIIAYLQAKGRADLTEKFEKAPEPYPLGRKEQEAATR